MPKKFTVSDGKLLLFLQPVQDGWYAVTSPSDPGITTQAKSVEEAFRMAYDAQKALVASGAQLAREFAAGTIRPKIRSRTKTDVAKRRARKSSKTKDVES